MICLRFIRLNSRLIFTTGKQLKHTRASNVDEQLEGKEVRNMPGPWPSLPVIGTSWIYSPIGPYSISTLHDNTDDMFQKYGNIYKEEMAGTYLVHVKEAKDMEAVFKAQGTNPLRHINEANVQRRRSLPQLYNTVGLVDSVGEEWHNLRKKVNPHLLRKRAVIQYTEALSLVTDDLMEVLAIRTSESPHIIHDLRTILFRWSLEALFQVSLGRRMGALEEPPSSTSTNLINLSLDLFECLADLGLSVPWWKIINTPTYKKFCKTEDELRSAVSSIITEVMKQDDVEAHKCMVGKFLQSSDLDERDINTLMVDFVAAAVGTVANFLVLLLHRLGQEPRVVQCIQREIDQVLDTTTTLMSDELMEQFEMSYMKAAVQEGFRLTSIISGIVRILPKAIVIQDYHIPPLTPILNHQRLACLQECNFPYPKQFLPERWLNKEEVKMSSDLSLSFCENLHNRNIKPNYLVMPFGTGQRVCVGRRMAELEIYIFMAKLLKKFDIKTEGPLKLHNRLLLAPVNHVPIKLTLR